MQNTLEIRGLTRHYKNFSLKDVSFSVPAGSIMGLIGPNGAGKTTLIKLIMNLLRKHGGEILVFGKDHQEHEKEIKSRIGVVYDEPAFLPDVSLSSIKNAIAPFYRSWDDSLFQTLVSEFELPVGKLYKKLSQGMKTKFALAMALSHHADLILLDEPTSGLDPVFRRELLERFLGIMQDSGKSILFSTHITSDLERIADHITFIRNGEILFSAPRDEIIDRYGIVRGGHDLLEKTFLPMYRGLKKSAVGVEALTDDRRQVSRMLGDRGIVEKASLEDIMVLMQNGGGCEN